MCILCVIYFSEEDQCKNLLSSAKHCLQSVSILHFCAWNLLTKKKLFVSELKQNYLLYDFLIAPCYEIHGVRVFNDDKCLGGFLFSSKTISTVLPIIEPQRKTIKSAIYWLSYGTSNQISLFFLNNIRVVGVFPSKFNPFQLSKHLLLFR